MRLRNQNEQYFAEINITPFVDVMLVLLVIFIVTLPVVVQNLSVKLPKAALPEQVAVLEPEYITVNSSGVIYYKDSIVTSAELFAKLDSLNKDSTTIVLQADEGNRYGHIAELLSDLRNKGFEKIGLSLEEK